MNKRGAVRREEESERASRKTGYVDRAELTGERRRLLRPFRNCKDAERRSAGEQHASADPNPNGDSAFVLQRNEHRPLRTLAELHLGKVRNLALRGHLD